MVEWMRLGVAAGTVIVALACAVIAAMTDHGRLRSSRRAQCAFRIAALLLVSCIPLVVLDGAYDLSAFSTSALALAAAGATALTAMGRRWVALIPRVATLNAPFGLGTARVAAISPMSEGPEGASRLRTVQLRVPVLLVAVTDDGYRVELNQN